MDVDEKGTASISYDIEWERESNNPNTSPAKQTDKQSKNKTQYNVMKYIEHYARPPKCRCINFSQLQCKSVVTMCVTQYALIKMCMHVFQHMHVSEWERAVRVLTQHIFLGYVVQAKKNRPIVVGNIILEQ